MSGAKRKVPIPAQGSRHPAEHPNDPNLDPITSPFFHRLQNASIDTRYPDAIPLQLSTGSSNSPSRQQSITISSDHPRSTGSDAGTTVEDEVEEDHSHCESAQVQSALSGLLHPSSQVLFQDPHTDTSSIPAFRQQVLDFLPAPKDAACSIATFRRFLRPALPALLDESFLTVAETFLLDATRAGSDKISLSWLAVMLMMMAIGQEVAIERQNELQIGTNTGSWMLARSNSSDEPRTDVFLNAAHRALRLLSFHSSPSLQTIYCQLLMGLYLLQTERIAVYWPIHGSIVRQAQAIGLHLEPKKALPDQQLRRQIWWAIVQQDVLLSSVFRLPLAISTFTCKATDPNSAVDASSCFRAQAIFAMLERRHLLNNMNQEWDKEKLDSFKSDLFAWYAAKPEAMQVTIDKVSQIDFSELQAKLRGKTMAAIEAMVDQFIHMQYTLLTLYRNRLQEADVVLREESYTICSNVTHNIIGSLSIMVDLLGTLQAGNLWLRLFFTFHAGVTAAYLAGTRSGTQLGKWAKDDLVKLAALCQRLPQRYKGLQTINDTFSLLLKQVEVKEAAILRRNQVANHTGPVNSGYTSGLSVGSFSSASGLAARDDVNMYQDVSTSLAHLSNEELSDGLKFGVGVVDTTWTGNFPGPFGPTDLLPGPQASGDEILSFWNQYFESPTDIEALRFG